MEIIHKLPAKVPFHDIIPPVLLLCDTILRDVLFAISRLTIPNSEPRVFLLSNIYLELYQVSKIPMDDLLFVIQIDLKRSVLCLCRMLPIKNIVPHIFLIDIRHEVALIYLVIYATSHPIS
jgi:hypothetical protein